MNAIIIHGTGADPQDYWYPSIARAIEKKGIDVWVPRLPDPQNPSQETTVPYLLDNGVFEQDTILIGHSSGVPIILGILERLNHQISTTILVAGFIEELPTGPKPNPVIKEWDWEKIRSNAGRVIIINSDDDPWGCDDEMGKKIWQKIGGDLVLRHGHGHMGSTSFHQPYKEFPLLEKMLF